MNNLSQFMKNKKVAVVMGGVSAEREVSLRSGSAVVKALNNAGVNAFAVDGVTELMKLDRNNVDAVFNILHGEAGENGQLAGLLSCLDVRFTGCDTQGAVLSWNKNTAKIIVADSGIKTPESQMLTDSSQLSIRGNGPWIIKPTEEGSSVGLYYAENESELKQYTEKALQTVESILVEQFIKGTEGTVSIVQNRVLPVIKIVPKVGLYDYQAKYQSTETQYFCPSGFEQELETGLKEDAMTVFKCLGLKGWGRVDFIVDEEGNRWFLEANTTPGMTETSLVPKAAAAVGWSFEELVLRILSTAFDDMGKGHV